MKGVRNTMAEPDGLEPGGAAGNAEAATSPAAPTPFACPHDHGPLWAVASGMRCARGHSFDRAREGYVNLLLPGQRSSRDPGDSRDMVAARRTLLASGAYGALADAIAEEVGAIVTPFAERGDRDHGRARVRIVESGCGEGYYLDHIARTASAGHWPQNIDYAGFDISKWAVRLAARRQPPPGPPIAWAVANARHPPFAPGTVDLIMCLFGFPIWQGFRTVQAAAGHVLLADPGHDHLIELRRLIYREVRSSPPPSLSPAAGHGYRSERERRVRFTTLLASADLVGSLLAMTPHAFRLDRDARQKMSEIDRLTVTVDVVLRHLVLESRDRDQSP